MKKSVLTVTQYALPDGFCVWAVPEGGQVSFWLGHQDCDVRELMFDVSAAFAPEKRWVRLIEDNLPDYLEDFREAWLEE